MRTRVAVNISMLPERELGRRVYVQVFSAAKKYKPELDQKVENLQATSSYYSKR